MCPSDSPANGVLVYAMVQITDNESTVTCFFCELILVPVIISTVVINGFAASYCLSLYLYKYSSDEPTACWSVHLDN